MFRLYEWNFSSTIELVTAVLLVGTILAVSFGADTSRWARPDRPDPPRTISY